MKEDKIKEFLGHIICGDCTDVMKKIPENSIDAIVTDPPYGLEFMGKDWDRFKASKQTKSQVVTWLGGGMRHNRNEMLNYQQFCYEWAKECFRVLKPGGYLLAFGGPRTFHRLACGIEDVGFEIRDTIAYIYGSGFPKALDISKRIDMLKGAKREVVGKYQFPDGRRRIAPRVSNKNVDTPNIEGTPKQRDITAPATPEAKQWQGWKTALKPAVEPIVVARKPLSEKTVAENVLKWRTGGLNVDGCRISLAGEKQPMGSAKRVYKANQYTDEKIYGDNKITPPEGRYPSNVIFECICDEVIEIKEEKDPYVYQDREYEVEGFIKAVRPQAPSNYNDTKSRIVHTNLDCPCYILDKQSGERKVGWTNKDGKYTNSENYRVDFGGARTGQTGNHYQDLGGASRFFYCAKVNPEERNKGCEEFYWLDGKRIPKEVYKKLEKENEEHKDDKDWQRHNIQRGNIHPTIKPVSLMKWLVRLVTPPNRIVLDPFAGSGSTLIACKEENFNFIGIEKEEEYCEIARARLEITVTQLKLF